MKEIQFTPIGKMKKNNTWKNKAIYWEKMTKYARNLWLVSMPVVFAVGIITGVLITLI